MITIRKLESLPRATRLRRIVKLLAEVIQNRETLEQSFVRQMCRIIRDDIVAPDGTAQVRQALTSLETAVVFQTAEERLRQLDDLRHSLMSHLGIAVADWDLVSPEDDENGFGAKEPAAAGLKSVGIYLDSVRSPFNLGSIVRTGAAFGVSSLGLSREAVQPDHPRALRSAMGSFRYVDVFVGGLDEYISAHFSPRVEVVALETDGDDIRDFAFPPTGVLVLGSEELGIRGGVRALATHTIRIPMHGKKRSLNVGVACGIALHAWSTRRQPHR